MPFYCTPQRRRIEFFFAGRAPRRGYRGDVFESHQNRPGFALVDTSGTWPASAVAASLLPERETRADWFAEAMANSEFCFSPLGQHEVPPYVIRITRTGTSASTSSSICERVVLRPAPIGLLRRWQIRSFVSRRLGSTRYPLMLYELLVRVRVLVLVVAYANM